MYLLCAGVFVTLFSIVSQVSGVTEKTPVSFTGAVIQYHPITEASNGSYIAEINGYNYYSLLDKVSSRNIDIIIFPEYGLTGFPEWAVKEKPFKSYHQDASITSGFSKKSSIVQKYRKLYAEAAINLPHPEDKVNLCQNVDLNFPGWLQLIACSAEHDNMYIVLNLYEHVTCPTLNCTSDNKLLYNTNIVIDNKGRLIAKYRKYNLFCEPWVDRPEKHEPPIFTTDFNVTFAVLFDLDILNFIQSQYFLRKHPNVTDFLYVTRKIEEIPMLLTTQDRNTWSDTFHVNILAAGFSIDGGSSIRINNGEYFQYLKKSYKGTAILSTGFPKAGDKENKLLEDFDFGFKPILLGDIVKNDSSNDEIGPTWTLVDLFEPHQYRSIPLNLTEADTKKQLCMSHFCCNFHLHLSFDKKLANREGVLYYRYRLVALSAIYRFSDSTNGTIELCMVMACTSDDINDCGRRFHTNSSLVYPTTFDILKISRPAHLKNEVFYGPLAQGHETLFQQNIDYTYAAGRHGNITHLLISLTQPHLDFHIFAISGRRFNISDKFHSYYYSNVSSNPKSYNTFLTYALPTVAVIGIMVLLTVVYLNRRKKLPGIWNRFRNNDNDTSNNNNNTQQPSADYQTFARRVTRLSNLILPVRS